MFMIPYASSAQPQAAPPMSANGLMKLGIPNTIVSMSPTRTDSSVSFDRQDNLPGIDATKSFIISHSFFTFSISKCFSYK